MKHKKSIAPLVIAAMAGIILVLGAALANTLGTIRQMQQENDRAAARVMLYPPHVLPAGPDQEGVAK